MMIEARRGMSMPMLLALGTALCVAPYAAPAANTGRPSDPLRFFEGRTESNGVIKLMAKKPFRSHAVGKGEVKADGTLLLVQRVEDEGRDPFERVWRIHSAGPGRWQGTMSEAKGPVTVDEVGGKYRFRFTMKGNFQVEQWIIPNSDWKSAVSKLTIKKFGMTVGRSDGTIRKVD